MAATTDHPRTTRVQTVVNTKYHRTLDSDYPDTRHNASCSYRVGMFYVELSDYELGEAGETVLGEVSSSRGEQRLIVIQSNTITEDVNEMAAIFTILF